VSRSRVTVSSALASLPLAIGTLLVLVLLIIHHGLGSSSNATRSSQLAAPPRPHHWLGLNAACSGRRAGPPRLHHGLGLTHCNVRPAPHLPCHGPVSTPALNAAHSDQCTTPLCLNHGPVSNAVMPLLTLLITTSMPRAPSPSEMQIIGALEHPSVRAFTLALGQIHTRLAFQAETGALDGHYTSFARFHFPRQMKTRCATRSHPVPSHTPQLTDYSGTLHLPPIKWRRFDDDKVNPATLANIIGASAPIYMAFYVKCR
jgi:hypothetical protein